VAEAQKLTFFQRKQIECPVCETKFYREDLLSGSGRLLAGQLTEELRRLYEPSKKFGEVFPLIYPVSVCPVCFYAAYAQDFPRLPEERKKEAEVNSDERRDSVSLIFPELDFTSPRTLKEGVASYLFALFCYEFLGKDTNPTFKSGLSALRAAWLLTDLHARHPADNYDYLAQLFYRKARFYYLLTLEKEQKGKEALVNGLQFGPDLDKNYGYDGLIYLASYLDFKHGSDAQADKRVASLEYAKRMIAKVFGMGRASKSRPSALLDQSKKIYALIGDEIAKFKGEGNVDQAASPEGTEGELEPDDNGGSEEEMRSE
jgi:uncharacterized protein (DUF2225 family)